MKVSPCLGCAYCCSKATCVLGAQVYGAQAPCPGLVWNKTKGRHFCKLLLESKGQLREFIADGLAIGAGCSSSLFNTWREDLRDRTGSGGPRESRSSRGKQG